MKHLIYLILLLLITSCTTVRVNEAKRSSPLTVYNIRQNNNYNRFNNEAMYIITAYREKDGKKVIVFSDEIRYVGDKIWVNY